MDTPLDRLVAALEAAPEALRGILEDWDKLDPDLQDHYAMDVEWLLRSTKDQIRQRTNDPAAHAILLRAEVAAAELAKLDDELESVMGIRSASILEPRLW